MKNDNELIDYFQKSRNIKEETVRGYEIYIKEYTAYFQTSMVDLLEEAEDEEEQGIRWKYRTLKKRLIDYRSYLYNKHAVTTAKGRFSKILAFYRHFEIEIHPLPKYNLKNTKPERPLDFNELINKEVIRDAIDIATPVMKPLIIFMCSSGCARTETRNLTIQDYIDATKNYHNGGDIYQVIYQLNQYDDVIPTFKVLRVKTNKYYTTFCSPEAVKSINNYLLSRPEELKPEDQLFKIGKSYFIQSFININNQLGLGKVGNYNRFRSHALRKFHASSLMNDGMNRDLVNDLQGRTKPITDNSYFFTDENSLKEEYIKHLPAVTIMKDVEKLSIKSPEFIQIEKENNKLTSELDEIKAEIMNIKKAFESK